MNMVLLVVGLLCLIVGIVACAWGVHHGLWHNAVWRDAVLVWMVVAGIWISSALITILQARLVAKKVDTL